jgi:hypothetical protein
MRLYNFRITPSLSRRLRVVAKLYGAVPSVFLRDMIGAICEEDQAKTISFLGRVQEGMQGQRQLQLEPSPGARVSPRRAAPARKTGLPSRKAP